MSSFQHKSVTSQNTSSKVPSNKVPTLFQQGSNGEGAGGQGEGRAKKKAHFFTTRVSLKGVGDVGKWLGGAGGRTQRIGD